MDNVVVRRCELTLHGRGGWGWGLEPHRYVDQALPEIERALQQVVAEADLPDGADVHLTEPVLLRWRPDHTLDDATRQTLVAALREALDALSRDKADEPGRQDAPAATQEPSAEAGGVRIDPAAVVGLAALLAAWSRTGRLLSMVSCWPEAVALQWVAALAIDVPGHPPVELEPETIDTVATAVLARVPAARPAPAAAHRWLVVLGALVAACGDRTLGMRTIRRAAHVAGATAIVRDLPTVGPPANPAAPWAEPRPAVRAAAPAPAAAAPGAPEARKATGPGLPFLVLVQLARLGYLDAVWAIAATTADPETTCAGLLGGLAGKVLPVPGRGWRREPDELAAVYAASGRYGADWDRTVHDLGRAANLVEAPLRTALTQLYAEPGPTEVELTETPYGAVLGERAGTLPIAWVADRDQLEATLQQLGDPARVTTSLFAHLAGVLHARRAYPGVDLPNLERQLGAAVGTALGSLAVEMWGTTTDAPSLALERLADLEVEIRAGSAPRGPDLTIAVPRGRRWLDLGRAGLLDRWPVPWSSTGWELVSW